MAQTPNGSSLRWIDLARLWSKVNIPDCPRHEDMCWEFRGSKVRGYGQIKINGQPLRVHRLTLEIATGEVGEVACHRCDNPACCNPRHLYWGTFSTNGIDMVNRHPIFADTRRRKALREEIGWKAGGGWRKGWTMVAPGLWKRPDGSLYETPLRHSSEDKVRTGRNSPQKHAGQVPFTKGERG